MSFVGVASSGEETKKSNQFSPFSPPSIPISEKRLCQVKPITKTNQYYFDIALKLFE